MAEGGGGGGGGGGEHELREEVFIAVERDFEEYAMEDLEALR